jgi:hypothetical protein
MPQLTIDLPEAAMPWLTRQAENENTTPESYLVSYVVTRSQIQEEEEPAYTDPAQKQLEDMLLERDQGPFIRITDSKALKERVMARALARIKQTTTHV